MPGRRHSIIPAQAGIATGKRARHDRAIPAFAGMTELLI